MLIRLLSQWPNKRRKSKINLWKRSMVTWNSWSVLLDTVQQSLLRTLCHLQVIRFPNSALCDRCPVSWDLAQSNRLLARMGWQSRPRTILYKMSRVWPRDKLKTSKGFHLLTFLARNKWGKMSSLEKCSQQIRGHMGHFSQRCQLSSRMILCLCQRAVAKTAKLRSVARIQTRRSGKWNSSS